MRRPDAPGEAARPVPGLAVEHRAIVAEFGRRAAAVPPERWCRPRAPGKWSPAQVVEHVALAYEQAAGELRGERVGRAAVSPFRGRLLRGLLLPAILWTRRLPVGAPAPRILQPSPDARVDATGEGVAAAQAALVRRFHDAATRFATAVLDIERGAPGGRMVHPYFGPLSPRTTWRLLTIHTRHHVRHIAPTAMPGTGIPGSH